MSFQLLMKTLFQKLSHHHVGIMNGLRICLAFVILWALVMPQLPALKMTHAGMISATWDTTKFLDQSFWNDNPTAQDIKRAVFWTTWGINNNAYTTGWTNPSACSWVNNFVSVSTTLNTSALDNLASGTIYILEPWIYSRYQPLTGDRIQCTAIIGKPETILVFSWINALVFPSLISASQFIVLDGLTISGASQGIFWPYLSNLTLNNTRFFGNTIVINAISVLTELFINNSLFVNNNQVINWWATIINFYISILNSLFVNNNNVINFFTTLENFFFSNNIVINNTWSVSLWNVNNAVIANNIISFNNSYWLQIYWNATGFDFSNNVVVNNLSGIFLNSNTTDINWINNIVLNNGFYSLVRSGWTMNYYGNTYSQSQSGDIIGIGPVLPSSNPILDPVFGSTSWYGINFGIVWSGILNCNWMLNMINTQGQTLFPLSACNDPNYQWLMTRGVRNFSFDPWSQFIYGKSILSQKPVYQRTGGNFFIVSKLPVNSNQQLGDKMNGWRITLQGYPSFVNNIPVVGGQTFTVNLWEQGYTNYEIAWDVTPVNGSIWNSIISVPLTFVWWNGLKMIRVRYTNGLLSSNWYQMTVNFQDLLVNASASLPGSTSTTGITLTIATDRTIAYQATWDIVGNPTWTTPVSTGITLYTTSTSGNKNITVTLSSGWYSRIFNLTTLYSTAVSLTPVDLEVTSLVSDTTLSRGDPLSFNITYRNRGTTSATNVVLAFTGSSFLRDITSNIANTRTNNTLIFTLGTLNSGAVGSILINSTVGAWSPGNWISNSIGITGDSEDTNLNNNTILLNSQIYDPNSSTVHNSASTKDPLDVIQQLYDVNQNLIAQLPSSVPVSTDTANNGYRSSIDTLLRYGIMKWYKFRSWRVSFSPNKNITVCEWRSIVDRMINLNGSVVNATNDSTCKNPKVWNKTITQSQAQQILEEKMWNAGHGSAQVEDLFDGGSSITRAEAANILVGAFRFEKDFLIGQNYQFMNLVYTKIQSRNIDQRRQFINRLIQKLNQFNEEDLSKIGLDKLKLLWDLTDALNGTMRSRSSNGAIQWWFDSLFN